MTLPNAPSGWAAYRALRQEPERTPHPRHGNYRHGMRTPEYRTIIRRLRFAAWALRKPGRLMALPDAVLDSYFPPRPAGWKASPFAAAARQRKVNVGEFVGDEKSPL
jgi:hypothetical protein